MVISDGTGMQALSKTIRKKTPKYPAEEIVLIIKDTSHEIIFDIIKSETRSSKSKTISNYQNPNDPNAICFEL